MILRRGWILGLGVALAAAPAFGQAPTNQPAPRKPAVARLPPAAPARASCAASRLPACAERVGSSAPGRRQVRPPERPRDRVSSRGEGSCPLLCFTAGILCHSTQPDTKNLLHVDQKTKPGVGMREGMGDVAQSNIGCVRRPATVASASTAWPRPAAPTQTVTSLPVC